MGPGCPRRARVPGGRDVIRVLLADDETLLRTALVTLLSLSGRIEAVAQAVDGLQAVAFADGCAPDVVRALAGAPRPRG